MHGYRAKMAMQRRDCATAMRESIESENIQHNDTALVARAECLRSMGRPQEALDILEPLQEEVRASDGGLASVCGLIEWARGGALATD